MKKTLFVLTLLCFVSIVRAQSDPQQEIIDRSSDRGFWLEQMNKMARPVLQSLAADSLKIVMPKITSKIVDNRDYRIQVQYLEVIGRVLCGIAPWLQLEGGDPAEIVLRRQYREWTISGLKNALDTSARDFIRFDIGGQQLVDASFLALAIVRAPWIWENLDQENQKRLVESIKTTRMFRPAFSNWLLFSAMNEVFLAKYGQPWDAVRVDYALRQLEQWYVGDGMYMDGEHYAYDYYNSYVIHPYLTTIMDVMEEKTKAYDGMFKKIKKRNQRYTIIQERLINTDGTYPASGRSIIYRGAVFHHLANMSWRKKLPNILRPAQVRGALTAVLRKTTESPSTYQDGWLTIGVYGEQWGLGDVYNNQGSLYLCTTILLPLGLPDTDEFWSAPEEPWSARLIWTGSTDITKDHSVDLR